MGYELEQNRERQRQGEDWEEMLSSKEIRCIYTFLLASQPLREQKGRPGSTTRAIMEAICKSRLQRQK